ncbi:RAM signaling pathway protein-domain-containing protein [Naematelia encephala]|uniref:RAM signaling pathway protein-domain-containing protein n=1 Tax=Naematelia encephala TaxID=71784 RepID=A0A1Y2B0J8_9TREE|nr:RAM signaling pathway protein-domain-containing protein [Naematelia encephala]
MTASASSSSTLPAPAPPPRSTLRVNTEDLGSRFRSNSAASPLVSPSQPYTYQHQSSRSLSATSPNDHVSRVVNGLRGGMSSPPPRQGPLARPSPPPPRLGETERDDHTLRRVQEALAKSHDEGDTLDLSRRRIEGIGEAAVNMFEKGVGKDKKGVWRLALSYNSLRDGSIVDSFARLSRLRYLNLKGNDLTRFPQALTQIASLEILDLSKNRITSFPDEPGRLAQLKVLSLTSNRLYTLPSYLVEFTHLKVFKVDLNPIEWPPREVLGALMDTDTSGGKNPNASSGDVKEKKDEDLRPWIENMKKWMKQRAVETDRLLARSKSDENGYLASDDEPLSAVSLEGSLSATPWSHNSLSSPITPSAQSTIRPVKEDSAAKVPVGSEITHRNRSATISGESLYRPNSPSPLSSHETSRHNHSNSTSSFTSAPPSASTASSSTHSHAPSTNLPLPPPPPQNTGHSRGASYTASQRLGGNIAAKKSLPDLRQSHAKIIQDRRTEGQASEDNRPLGLGINAPAAAHFQSGPPAWNLEMARSATASAHTLERSLGAKKRSADMLRAMKSGQGIDLSDRRNSQEAPLVDESRNSYFRRHSMLPVSSISKTIPPALLRFIDAIRGILFALSQVHSALRQYLVFAVNERVASVFTRVMEPVNKYMDNLINALDRFDSMSRRNIPPIHAIRGVLDATKESVAVFAKVASVLRLQLPAMRGNDVRYSRTLLLMIYGSMAEVANSWKSMAPLLSDIKPLLSADVAGLAARALMGGMKMVPTGSLTGRTPISPIPERAESHSPPSVGRPSVPSIEHSPLLEVTVAPVAAADVQTPRSRRQGGSFSTQDVEKGMLMGSVGPSRSDEGAGYLRHRPSESAQIQLEGQVEETENEGELETPSFPIKTISPNGTTSNTPLVTQPEPPTVLQPVAMMSNSSHSGSRLGHKPSSSSGSSHALSLPSGFPAPLRKLSVDVRPPTPASATLFDEDLLDVIETATDIAFTVWLKLAEDVGASTPPFASHSKSNSQSSTVSNLDSARMGPPSFTPVQNARRPSTISVKHHMELLSVLSQAEQITAALRESLMALRANPLLYTQTTLPDDAQAFIKTVVRVSELVRIISTSHSFPGAVRQSISRLTQATRECAILIQVSSLRPGNATPAPMPPSSARSASPMHFSRSSRGGGPESSTEDLAAPNSAGNVPNSATGWGGPPREGGLRGLQLPTRMAMGRNRSAGSITIPEVSSGPVPRLTGGSLGGSEGYNSLLVRAQGPRSAQASQSAF